MIIGERLSEGNVLYRDLWTETGPAAATVYWIIDSLFGRSQAVYKIIALLLVGYQSLLFNRILIRSQSLSQPMYIPALIYACLSILSTDFLTLSPQLMANTSLLMALSLVSEHIMNRMKQDERIQYIGFFLIISTLLYFPYVVFLVGVILVLMIFTGTILRRYFLIAYGYFIPLILVAIYYWYMDGLTFFWQQFVVAGFLRIADPVISAKALLLIASVPAIFLLFAIAKFFGRIRYTNFQITLIQVIILLFVFAGIGYWLSPFKSPHSLLIFLPFAAYLISHFFALIKRRFTSELVFAIFLTLIILWNMSAYSRYSPANSLIDLSGLMAGPSKWDKVANGKRVMLLTPELNVLRECTLASPGLNWEISSQVYKNPDEYSKMVMVYNQIKSEKPELIIDPSGLMNEIFRKMPSLKAEYRQSGEYWYREI